MMTCEQFIDHLLDFEEGDLPSETDRLCREHSALCQECADYLDSYRKTVVVGKAAFKSDSQGSEPVVGPADDQRPTAIESYELPEELVQSILTAAGAVR